MESNLKSNMAQVYEQTTEKIRELIETTDGAGWEIGDLLVQLTKDAPNKKAIKTVMEEVAKDVALEYPTLMSYRWVSTIYTKAKRSISPSLSYTHYRAAAGMEDPITWLEKAADEGWSVSQLKSKIVETKEDKKIKDESTPCARPGCSCPLPLESANRVSAYVYGKKLIFCSAACAGNMFINSLMQIKQQILGESVAPDSESTPLVKHPDSSVRGTLTDEQWWKIRTSSEQEYFSARFV